MILVTGSTGLVGTHLLYRLANNNEQVRAIYRDETKLHHVKHVFSSYTEDYERLFNTIEWVKADILDIPALAVAFKDIDYVYHCAALVSFQPHEFQILRKVNIEGTANIVNFCIANKVKKLCYVSSIATLGQEPQNTPITENSIWNPEKDHSVYAISKYGAEMEVWRGTQEGVNAVIVNPGVILGSGFWNNGSGSLFKKAHKGLKYYTSGTIGLIDVNDVVSIMISLLKSDIKNERYVLVAENWSYKEFLTALATSVNTKAPKTLASKMLLNLLWRLDWLKYTISGKPRKLTKQLTNTLNSTSNYNSDKIKELLNYNFKDINNSILETAKMYLNRKN